MERDSVGQRRNQKVVQCESKIHFRKYRVLYLDIYAGIVSFFFFCSPGSHTDS